MTPSNNIETILRFIKRLIPARIFKMIQPTYHYATALLATIIYRFPSRKIKVLAITGTKGKTSTAEIINAILEEAGYRTALSGTIRFKVGDKEERNMLKMTTPGRLFIQRFLRRAVNAKCDWAIIEMTSEGARQFRHKFVDLDALIFTNISPEHIESHGSFEKYLDAKLSISRALASSPKRPRIIIANADNKHAKDFLAVPVETKKTYSIKDALPYTLKKNSTNFNLMGSQVNTHLPGVFNLSNMLAGISFAHAIGIETKTIRRALSKFHGIRGRVEFVNAGQDFDVVVDYAHTADSLEKIYEVFEDSRKICVLGCAGGGRDTWKRPVMGATVATHCDEIILTNQDSYDEPPQKIISEIVAGITGAEPTIILDRREAIAHALSLAKTGDAVIITGKGADPYIMGPNGSKMPWDDATVANEELIKLGYSSPC